MTKTPDWRTIAAQELPPEEQAAERYEAAADRLHAALMRTARLLEEHEPEVADYFRKVMCQAMGGKR